MQDRQGNVTEYYDRTRPLTAEQISTADQRRMDCIDCHNRPAHVYLPPDVAVDQSFAAGRLDPTLPYLKREATASLSQPYATENEAVKAIATSLDAFYRTNYDEVYRQKGDAVKDAISETQRIYQTYFFPERKRIGKLTRTTSVTSIRQGVSAVTMASMLATPVKSFEMTATFATQLSMILRTGPPQ